MWAHGMKSLATCSKIDQGAPQQSSTLNFQDGYWPVLERTRMTGVYSSHMTITWSQLGGIRDDSFIVPIARCRKMNFLK